MKKKIAISIISITLMSLINTSFASDVCKKSLGVVSCGSGSVKNVDALGYVNLNGTTITNRLGVVGKVTAKNANLNAVSCIGDLTIKNSVVQRQFNVTGVTTATKTIFLGPIDITGPETTFNNSTTKKITVNKAEHSGEKIYLTGSSVVNGSVIFESGNGFVMESSGASVTGSVIGGKIIHQ